MATIRKQGRAIKRLVPGVPTSSHDPAHWTEKAERDGDGAAERKPGNRHQRRKAAALARKGKVA